jgi:chromosomal replication initiator protein
MGNLNIEEVWLSIKKDLKVSANPILFNTYINNGTYIKKIDESDNLIEITAPTEHHRNNIEDRLYGVIKEIVIKQLGPQYRLMFSVTKKEPTQLSIDDFGPLFEAKKEKENNIELRKKEAGLNLLYNFERLIVGNHNRLAYAVATAITENPGRMYNPFFLYSGVGLGKTHLVQAIGHKIIEKNPNINVLYRTGEQFLNEVVDAIRKNKNPRSTSKRTALKNKYRNIDVLIIDDIQFIAGKDSTQEEFFHTFNALYMSQKQIILTSDKHPKEIKTLEERLSSRFASGMIADIQKPDIETKLAILQERNEELKLRVNNEVLEHKATMVDTNIRELEGKLLQTATKARSEGLELNKSSVIKILGEINQNKKKLITPDSVIKEVCQYYDVTIKDIKGQRRMKPLVIPRQICMYLLREVNNMGLQNISELLGRKDHTTVIHGIHKVEDLLKKDPKYKSNLEDIKQRLFL